MDSNLIFIQILPQKNILNENIKLPKWEVRIIHSTYLASLFWKVKKFIFLREILLHGSVDP